MRDHASRSADLARAAGCNPRMVELIRNQEHQRTTLDGSFSRPTRPTDEGNGVSRDAVATNAGSASCRGPEPCRRSISTPVWSRASLTSAWSLRRAAGTPAGGHRGTPARRAHGPSRRAGGVLSRRACDPRGRSPGNVSAFVRWRPADPDQEPGHPAEAAERRRRSRWTRSRIRRPSSGPGSWKYRRFRDAGLVWARAASESTGSSAATRRSRRSPAGPSPPAGEARPAAGLTRAGPGATARSIPVLRAGIRRLAGRTMGPRARPAPG